LKKNDILHLYYTYYAGGGNQNQANAFAGVAAACFADFDRDWRELDAITASNTCLTIDSDYYSDRDSTIVNARRLRILTAEAFYSIKFFESAYRKVQEIEPTFSLDTNAPDFISLLGKKIEELLQ
jgi:hypothetical protein